MIPEILGLLVNILTSGDKYNLRKSENLPRPIQMQLSKKQKNFSKVFAQFLKSTSNIEQFEKKMSLMADIFRKLQSAKNVVRKMSKKPRLRTPFDNQHAKGSRKLTKSAQKHFYHTFSWLWGSRVRKCLSVIFEILGLFANTLTAYDKYSFRNSENSQQQIQK